MNYENLLDFKTLYDSLKKCCRSVRWKDSVVGYEANGLKNTYLLKQSLFNGTYKIDKYQRFYITEPKRREIVATRIKDRQFQRALCDCGFYEEITKGFIYHNYACQTGKGIRAAQDGFTDILRRYYRKHGNNGWILKCDVNHFFASIDHEVAKQAVRKRVSNDTVCKYVFDIIDSFGDIGLGLGSQISQLIALSVLDDLDHFIKEKLRIKYYVRYMDDFILIHEDKYYLKYARKEIIEFLKSRHLTLNKKTALFPLSQGVYFLKWRYILTGTGKVIKLMQKRKLKRSKRHYKKLIKRYKHGNLPLETVLNGFKSWCDSASAGNTRLIQQNMKKLILKEIQSNEQVRCL